MTERLLASDPHYEELNRLQNMWTLIVNVELAYKSGMEKTYIAGQLVDLSSVGEAEIKAIKQKVKDALEGQLNKVQIASLESVYGEFVEGLRL